ncbi:hypothetical protein FQR65_LT10491 [Abscondita terminalis]|nr:hypothetical protein FQR65_LT10491 [Abscondita terminalis]
MKQSAFFTSAVNTMELPDVLRKLFKLIDENRSTYIKNLAEAVAIRSISGQESRRKETCAMVDWTAERLRALGFEVFLNDIGTQTLPNGHSIPLPPVLQATLGRDPRKKTVCVYGHLDVTPADQSDGWLSDPFVLIERDKKLYGRGASDDKGPILCWMHVIEAYQKLKIEIPVNIKMILESMEESGGLGIEELLENERDGFLKGIDYFCISDNYWLGNTQPCITYGLRGICYFTIEIQCASTDLHSGGYGGSVYEAMPDLIYMLNTLVDKEGNILITDINKDVAPLEPNEKNLYSEIDFDVNAYRERIGATKLPHNANKIDILMRRWRYPSLSIHAIEGLKNDHSEPTLIPAKVVGKFSIRTVPNQTGDSIEKTVIDYLNKKWKERDSPNTMKATMIISGPNWVENPNHEHYMAGQRAVKHTFGQKPDLTREGGSIPIAVMFQKITGKSVILLPIGGGDDNVHSQNEKINVRNYIEGTKLFGAYLYEVSRLSD